MIKRLSLIALLAGSLAAAVAGPGHDHGDAPPQAAPNAPQRLADGSVFLPKPAQRLMQLRTLPVSQAALPRATELQAMVLMDPNAGGKVQASQAGRVLAPPGGLPGLGQRVQRGQLLAYLEPVSGALERSAQAAQVAELQSAAGLAEKRLLRLRELADTVPRRDIEAAEAELLSLRERLQLLRAGLAGREALRAPVSGLIASATGVAGQLVDARELLFEIADPGRLRIEALAYEPELAQDIAGAYLVKGGQALRFLGAAGALREQALPLHFALQDARTPLALGQSLRVLVQSRSRVDGFALPATALQRNASNQSIVWVKTAPERFAPRVVKAAPLDGSRVAVTQGLAAGERVVGDGAALLSQIR